MEKITELFNKELNSNHGIQNIHSLIKNNTTLRSILNSLNEGVIIADQNGKLLFFNPVAKKILGIGLQNIKADDWSSVYGCFYSDKTALYPSEQLPMARALKNEKVLSEIIFIKNPISSTFWAVKHFSSRSHIMTPRP